MAVENPRILTKNYGVAQSWTIDVYEKSCLLYTSDAADE